VRAYTGRGEEAFTHTTLHRVCKAEPQKQDVLPAVDAAQRNIKTGSGATPFFMAFFITRFSSQ
jgi:hypothetical protein